LVRRELDYLLKEDLPYGRIPEPSQVSAFVAEWERTGHGAKACDATPADFMIDIAGEPRTPWNIAAGRIFTDHFIHKMEYDDTQETRKAVEKVFINRVKSLRSRYKEKEIPQVERASKKSKHSRQQRKYQVSLYLLLAVSQLVIYNFQCSCFIVVVT
jgi:hypothetical protein